MLDEKITYEWSEQQLLEIDDCRKKASEISRYLDSLSWLFRSGDKREQTLIRYAELAERIEIFCEQQLPF